MTESRGDDRESDLQHFGEAAGRGPGQTAARLRRRPRLGAHHTPKNLLLAPSGEVGELCAELQWHPTGAPPQEWNADLRERVTDEVADVLIYLVRFADVCGIDPIAAAEQKIERNESRFPPLP